jgi:acetylornithine deacetylase/succinyl-diaminopimelate desuccinylase-like protein
MIIKDPVKAVAEWIRCPSVSTDPSYLSGMHQARDYLALLFEQMGLKVSVVETQLHPIILAERSGPEEWPHVVIYGHYDVQPADPFELWTTPPFEPEIRDGRLYGRGAADNKGPFMVHLAAVDRLLSEYPNAPIRITFLVEGEEEIGSPSFPDFIKQYSEQLKADFVLLSDTSSQSPEQICITTGLRGIVCMEMIARGPAMDLHSGVHGGAVVNPIMAIARICASLHDSQGRVQVPHFYDEVMLPSDWEREELNRLNLKASDYESFLGVNALMSVPGFTPFESIRFQPTIEFNGIGGGYQGEGSKTVIPSIASVKISCRLVASQSSAVIRDRVKQFLQAQCPKGITLEFNDQHCGEPYCVIPPDRPNTPVDQNAYLATAFRAADKAIGAEFGLPPMYLREGGSVPIIGTLKTELGLDSVMIGMFTSVDNLHAPNESFHLGMFEKGISVSYRILKAVAGL